MRSVSPKRAKLNRDRVKAEAILGRDKTQGQCACCGLYGYVNGHERRARSQGGDPANPDCLACPMCNELFEMEPRWAAWNGWKLSRKYDRDPKLALNQARRLDESIHVFPAVRGYSE